MVSSVYDGAVASPNVIQGSDRHGRQNSFFLHVQGRGAVVKGQNVTEGKQSKTQGQAWHPCWLPVRVLGGTRKSHLSLSPHPTPPSPARAWLCAERVQASHKQNKTNRSISKTEHFEIQGSESENGKHIFKG